MSAWPAQLVNPTLELEKAVLGAVLCHNARYWDCAEAGLQPHHFAYSLHRRLWTQIDALVRAGSEASPLTLRPRLLGDDELEAAGGMAVLAKLATQSAGIVNVADYARQVRECAGRRSLVELSDHMARRALDGQADYQETLLQIDAAVDECRPPALVGGIKPLSVALQAALASNQRARELGAVDGVAFGLKALDRLIGGAAKSDLVVLAGRPGMGKSALAAHIALHNARLGKRVVLFSLEMSQEQIANRLLAQAAGIGADKLRRGATNAAQHSAMLAAEGELAALPLFIDEMPAIDQHEMRARLKRHRAAQALDLVVVDYLQLMTSVPHSDNRVQQVSMITAALKALAKEFDVPVIALSQLSRAVELRDDKRPRLADLRESGSIEQDADAVIFLYRPDYYLVEPKDPASEAHRQWQERSDRDAGKAELIVAKNRHGPCDTARVGFEAAFTRFHDLVP